MVIKLRRVDVGLDEVNELLNQAGLASVNTMEILQGGWDLSLIHISEPTRRRGISYAVFCLKKKK